VVSVITCKKPDYNNSDLSLAHPGEKSILPRDAVIKNARRLVAKPNFSWFLVHA
jgi:hypothetical protein